MRTGPPRPETPGWGRVGAPGDVLNSRYAFLDTSWAAPRRAPSRRSDRSRNRLDRCYVFAFGWYPIATSRECRRPDSFPRRPVDSGGVVRGHGEPRSRHRSSSERTSLGSAPVAAISEWHGISTRLASRPPTPHGESPGLAPSMSSCNGPAAGSCLRPPPGVIGNGGPLRPREHFHDRRSLTRRPKEQMGAFWVVQARPGRRYGRTHVARYVVNRCLGRRPSTTETVPALERSLGCRRLELRPRRNRLIKSRGALFSRAMLSPARMPVRSRRRLRRRKPRTLAR